MSISEFEHGKVKLWVPIEEVESTALTQLRNIARLPWLFHHVAVMPDVHFGKGATVGSVIAMKNAVSPAAVGVDIGCGMGAIRTSIRASQLPDNLKPLRLEIEHLIPTGKSSHDSPVLKRSNQLFDEFSSLHHSVQDREGIARKQIGTLGGGNHFIELCLDEGSTEPCPHCFRSGADCDVCGGIESVTTEPRVWMMLHSGSRNIGKTLAEIHMNVAKKLSHNAELPDKDLSVFLANTPEMEAYRRDLYWAQRYAFENRKAMFELYQKALGKFFPKVKYDKPILCHHNYVAEEIHYGENVFVTRKGAISATPGELGIIPGSMGAKSFIVEGLGNEEAFSSASHGAGRKMSRGAAKRTFTLDDLIEQTKGVECPKVEGVLDEIPGAYKDIIQVMKYQSDLVKIKHELKQVLCVKAHEDD